MTGSLRGVGSKFPYPELLQQWVDDYARGRYTEVAGAWAEVRPALPVTELVADPRAVEAVGWSLALTKQWDAYSTFRADVLPLAKEETLRQLIAILDGWRAIHEARYDASLYTVRSARSALLEGTSRRVLCHALKVEGVALFRMGRYHEAEALTRRALELFHLAGDALNVSHCATNLGLILNARGEIRAARDELQRSLAALLGAGAAEERLALARENLAIVEVHLGNVQEAKALYEAALATFSELDLRTEQVSALNGLGHCARLEGRFTEACAHHESALRLADGEMPRQVGLCHEFLGQLYFDTGDLATAEEHYEKALETAATIAPDGDLMVETCWRYGELLAVQRRVEECRDHVTRAEALCEANRDRRELGCVQRARARLLAAEGRWDDARTLFGTAVETLGECGRLFEAALTRVAHGETELDSGDAAAAASALESARETLASLLPGTRWVLLRRAGGMQSPAARKPLAQAPQRHGLVTCDEELVEVLENLPTIAGTEYPVLLEGESGTGKELLARAIHSVARCRGPFIAVNCAAIPRDLFESELFGHTRGAFSGAVADKPGLIEQAADGVLLLDEISEMPHELQPKLLRVLDDGRIRRLGDLREREVRVKIVAATNKSLEASVAAGRFRSDLFYRLAVHHVPIKPLRERKADIELLARFFLQQEKLKEQVRLTPELVAHLQAQPWPGNVRELRNVLIRRATQHRNGDVTAKASGARDGCGPGAGGPLATCRSLRDTRSEHERRVIEATLRETSGNVSAAARRLHMHVTTLRRKMHTLGVRRPS
ncbi:MAG: sigma 54-interacting transcriptional regulator [Candidatus Krumholzibacteriia bacterium]